MTRDELFPGTILYTGDCLEVLQSFPDNSIDACVTDPPAGISFMGKDWDHDKGGRDKWIAWMTEVAREYLRVLKPGAHAFVWALPRTSHWTATAWENAGFEVRDRVEHIFSTGFPKSHNIGLQIDKVAGAKREVMRIRKDGRGASPQKIENHGRGDTGIGHADGNHQVYAETFPATPEAKEWDGWGTALKPAMEDWWLFRKPISEKTVAANVLKWGTGALNIDACRVPGEPVPVNKLEQWSGFGQVERPEYVQEVNNKGRWPAQVVHDGSEEVVSLFPDSDGQLAPTRGDGSLQNNTIYGGGRKHNNISVLPREGKGSAARFFYCAKPTQAERNAGLDGTCTIKYNLDKSKLGDLSCQDVSTEVVQLLQKVISESMVKWDIAENGESITARCQQDSLSIISTEISKIIQSKILDLSTLLPTNEFTLDANYETEFGGNLAMSAESSSQSIAKIGTSQKKDTHYTDAVRSVTLELLSKMTSVGNWRHGNFHITVKAQALMTWLIKLITPPGGVVLDAFMGSGSTGVACTVLGNPFIGIDSDPDYVQISKERILSKQLPLFPKGV